MRRREFIGLIGGVAVSPIAGRAQQPAKMKRLAVADPALKVADMRIGGDPGYTSGSSGTPAPWLYRRSEFDHRPVFG